MSFTEDEKMRKGLHGTRESRLTGVWGWAPGPAPGRGGGVGREAAQRKTAESHKGKLRGEKKNKPALK